MKNFFNGKKIIITGATGFKGSWLSIILKNMGANVVGIGLPPNTKPSIFELTNLDKMIKVYYTDIRNLEEINKVFEEERADIVFHLAAQPLVIEAYNNPKFTYETNAIGTFNVLECIRNHEVDIAVMVTTDKCYENKGQLWGYRENDELGGSDPYSASKACSELIISSMRRSYFGNKKIASARAGNVIGGGDWSENRLIPDIIRALEKNEEIQIRSPNSTRPWQHVLESLFGYMLLATKLGEDNEKFATSFNFAPRMEDVQMVETLVIDSIKHWGSGGYKILPNSAYYEAKLLNLDISKSYYMLNWKPVFNYSEAIEHTINWYKNYKSVGAYELCIEQIEHYQSLRDFKK